MAIDPICGMTVDEQKALQAEVSGQKYYFCCEHCRTTYLKQVSELGRADGVGIGGAARLAQRRDVVDVDAQFNHNSCNSMKTRRELKRWPPR